MAYYAFTGVQFLVLLFCCLAVSMVTANVLVGLNDHFIWRGSADQDVAISWVQASHAQVIRSDVNWASLEPSKGAYSQTYLSRLDYVLAKYSQLGVRVLLMLGTSPGWANGNNTSSWAPPLDPNDFATFCEFVVRRWGKFIDAIEIWNEPSLSRFWASTNTQNSAAGLEYARLVHVAGPRIRAAAIAMGVNVAIGAPVIHASYGAVTSGWLGGFYSFPNITQAYDVFCVHDYWFGVQGTWPPNRLTLYWNASNLGQSIFGAFMKYVWPAMQVNGDQSKPIWFTETGGAARSNLPDYAHVFLSFDDQKRLLQDMFKQIDARVIPNLARVYWFELFDSATATGTDSEQYYGLLSLSDPVLSHPNAVVNNKPAFQSFQAYLATSTTDVVPSVLPKLLSSKGEVGISSTALTLVIAGGWGSSGMVKEVELRDLTSGGTAAPTLTMDTGASYISVITNHPLAYLIGGMSLVRNPYAEFVAIDTIRIVNLTTGAWVALPPNLKLSKPRCKICSVVVGNKLLMSGGDMVWRGSRNETTVEEYDLLTNQLQVLHFAGDGRAGHSCGVIAGKAYFGGGSGLQTTIDVYANGVFSTISLPNGEARMNAAMCIAGTKIFLAGGYKRSALSYDLVGDVFIYDTIAQQWTVLVGKLPSPSQNRWTSCLTVGNSIIFVSDTAGSVTNTTSLPMVNVITGVWSATTLTGSPAYGRVTTTSSDGTRGFVVGGWNNVPIDSVIMFTATTAPTTALLARAAADSVTTNSHGHLQPWLVVTIVAVAVLVAAVLIAAAAFVLIRRKRVAAAPYSQMHS